MRLRTIVAVRDPGAELDSALESAADAVLFSVATNTAPAGDVRGAASEFIEKARAKGKAALVTVNHPRTQLLRDDLDALVRPGLSAVFLASCLEPQDVRDTAVLLREFELQRDIEPGAIAVFPVLSTARGVVRAGEIVAAAPRTGGLVFESDAYARDIGARAEERGPRLAYARGTVVAAARAHDRLPLVVASNFELREHSQYGFAGVVLADTQAMLQANAAFGPNEREIVRARLQVEAYEAARAEGAWVARLGDEIVDASMVRRARQALE